MKGQAQRLGKNLNGYFGERIEIDSVLGECVKAARLHGWDVQQIAAAPDLNLLAFVRDPIETTGPFPRVYLSTGIHGDEPAGPLAALHLLRENQWPKGAAIWLCPCLNPTGFTLNRRENRDGFDLNREYHGPTAAEIKAHIHWLNQQPSFELCLCLHEDWESHGFYVYELNPDNQASLAPAIVQSAASVCPIDTSETIEGRPAKEGIIRPSIDPRSRPQWPEAFFLLTHKTRLSYTLEAPSDFELNTRVAALSLASQAAINGLLKPGN